MSDDLNKCISGFGLRLKELREVFGPSKITQGVAAKMVNKQQNEWSRWEKGRLPDFENLANIALTFKVSLDWLVLGKGEPHGIPDKVFNALSDIRKSIKEIDMMTKKGSY